MTTIIHINNNSDAQDEVRNALGTTYQLVSVSDAPTAIQYSAMIRPSLILIDANLPGLTDLIHRLKMFMPQAPILVLAEPATSTSACGCGTGVTRRIVFVVQLSTMSVHPTKRVADR